MVFFFSVPAQCSVEVGWPTAGPRRKGSILKSEFFLALVVIIVAAAVVVVVAVVASAGAGAVVVSASRFEL